MCINHATDNYNVHYQELGSLISSQFKLKQNITFKIKYILY